MTDYADIQCDEMTCKTWPKSWQRFTLSFLARDTNGTRVWVGKNRLLFTLDSSTLARISSFHILSLLIIYSNWLWANFNLEKFISWCLKINGWFFRQKTTWLLKIAIYLMTLIRETKKYPFFGKKNLEMHHCHHCCNYGTFLHHLVHPGLSSHGQDEELGILNMSCCTMHSGKILIKKCNFRYKYH